MTRADVPLVMTLREAAAELRVSKTQVLRFIRANELRAARVGKRVVIEGADFVAFFNSRKLRAPYRNRVAVILGGNQ
jgi:excisionase family DNA binding protein